MIRPGVLQIASLFFAVQICFGAVEAADLVAPEPPVVEAVSVESPWSGQLAIYGWLPWMSGDAGINSLPPVSFSLDPSDILNALDMTIQATGDISYDRFGLFGDIVYMKISGSNATSVGPLVASADLGVAMTVGTLAGAYEFYKDDTTSLKALAGARYWSVDTTLSLALIPIGATSGSETISWWDPVVGLRGRKQLTDKIYVTATGLIGGFGVGSEFMWDVFGGIGYEFNDHLAITAGWRGMGVDYSDGGDIVDMTSQGPLIGVGFRF
ncbi:hypothetical protein K1W69_06740 [Hoeflea sp. WL0058]|uniref:Outer membrane protein beta-barrel domain-containing protein n=1 Tax=Flavimaribacter sediminis TaxID=2865987 RepID=A0AAE3CZP0_9HYPH|nr:hypothetical protein [Flavimaribacter sediminis]MBW8636879.1 hypothetical protein [Flavimaribacter sediminis]